MKRYINSISSFQFFQLARYSTFILIGIVFTKTALSQTSIGEYETFLFIAGAVSFFWLNGLLTALLPLSQSKEKGSVVFSAFVVIQVFSILSSIFLYSLKPQFSGFLLSGREIPEIGLIVLFICIGVPANLVEYVYLIKKKSKSIIIYAIISFFIQFVLIVLPPLFNKGIEWSIKGLVFSAILRYLWLWVLFVRYSELSVSFKFIQKHLKLGGPLIAATFLSGSAQFIDGFIITAKFDESTFAVFRYGARELPLAMLLANALSNAMLPEFAKKDALKENLRKLKESVFKLMKFLFPVTVILLLISYPLFPVIFNPKFAESATIFNVYLLLVISRLLMPQTILNGLQMGNPIMLASFFELVLNVSLSLFFVQFFGISGVAYATVVAFFAEKIYLIVFLKRKLKISISEYIPLKTYFLFSIGIIVVFLMSEFILKNYGFYS